ncbi:L,D-transpeptidase family protein [Erythrobacter sp. sf7]|uniref:L,D-transpeptidase family protein n=1 Tax=Erythrobacter fulvus TaxID=2987523 RepID=A0ABT5JS84_9SPHN|nr:L,D-transpeptidase family protein [Erythrobacter fulvus]MDC8755633.1 L,D-transpeptidase family protein [Erythrobacter fulvus]
MRRGLIAVMLAMLLAAPSLGQQPEPGAPEWSVTDLASLGRWIDAAPEDALPRLSTAALDTAVAAGDRERIDEEAGALALRLARIHLLGSAAPSERTGWRIVDPDREIALAPMLEQALASHTLDTFFALQRPAHRQYAALRRAYADEQDAEKRRTIARNMERWRWMPRSLGSDYVLVNAARFEATLWRDDEQAGTWRVIVGKQSTPTPVFDATIEGVILNPWWEIPASIVRESVGALVRRNPALARQRGYVWSGGRYRQRPGPNNALGQMKLVMPNPFSVYMHDTPSKQLFDEEVRAYSHGCIRTDDALGYAATLLDGVRTREEIDAIIASGKTTTVRLARPIPVYVAYFTAVSDGEGGVMVLPDIYRRDAAIRSVPSGN